MRRFFFRRGEGEQILRGLRDPSEITPSLCAWCGKRQHLASRTTEGAIPREGDACVCLSCGGANQYGEGMRLEPLDWTKLDAGVTAKVKRLQEIIAASKTGGAA